MGIIKNKYVANKNIMMVSSIIWSLLTLICVLSIVFHSYPVVKIGYIYIIIFRFPFLILAGLYGYLISMISFIACFLVTLIASLFFIRIFNGHVLLFSFFAIFLV